MTSRPRYRAAVTHAPHLVASLAHFATLLGSPQGDSWSLIRSTQSRCSASVMSGVGTCASDVICGPPLRAASLAPDAVGADPLLPFPLPVQPAPSEMAEAQLSRAQTAIAPKPCTRTRVRESAISTKLRERVRGFETRTAEIIE